jgi:HEAT repeat protein
MSDQQVQEKKQSKRKPPKVLFFGGCVSLWVGVVALVLAQYIRDYERITYGGYVPVGRGLDPRVPVWFAESVVTLAAVACFGFGAYCILAALWASIRNRRGSARAGRTLEGKEGVEDLVNALNDQDEYVREEAARKLGALRSTQAVESLIPLLDDPDYAVRKAAAEALRGIGDRRAVEPLKQCLVDDDYDGARGEAAWAIGEMEGVRAIPVLIKAMDKGVVIGPLLRGADKEIVAVLVTIGEPAVEPLIEALAERGPKARKVAAHALGQLGDPRAVEPLIEALRDEEPPVQSSAAIALGSIGDARAIGPLRAVARSGTDMGKVAAKQMLRKLQASGVRPAPVVREEGKAGVGGYPPRPGFQAAQSPRTNLWTIASLVLGIVSIGLTCCYGGGIPFGIAGFIVGLLGRRQVVASSGTQRGEGAAWAGMILGGIGTLLGLAWLLLTAVSVLLQEAQ